MRETPGSIPGSPNPRRQRTSLRAAGTVGLRPRPGPRRTVCFLYGYSPSGHSLAAAALKDELRLRLPQWRAVELALASDVHPLLGPVVSRAYLELIQRTPRLWDALYDSQLLADALQELKPILSLSHRRKLHERLSPLKPDLVVCTHALPCATLALEKREGRLRCPLVAVITDFGVHAYWVSEEVDLYLAPTAAARAELIKRGIRPSRVRVTGIPVNPRFRRPLPPLEARRRLGLDPARPAILIQGGTRGLGPIREETTALLSRLKDVQIVAACGRNKELFSALKALERRRPRRLKVLPFVPMDEVLPAADLVVGKAGGLTLSESLAVGAPLVIVSPLPGQEERNASVLASLGAAVRVEEPSALAGTVESLLADPGRLAALRRRAARLGRPDSAEQACRAMLSLVKAPSI